MALVVSLSHLKETKTRPSPGLKEATTRAVPAPEHVEQPPRRREAVKVPRGRRGARRGGGEVGPGHGGGVVGVQVAEWACGMIHGRGGRLHSTQRFGSDKSAADFGGVKLRLAEGGRGEGCSRGLT